MDLRPRDIELLRKLNEYKYLTSTALYRFTRDLARNEGRLLNRLTKLREYGYISRDDELTAEDGIQYKTRDAVYQITSTGKAALLDEGIEPADFDWCTGPLSHDFASCASVSSIELACKDGLEFVPSSFFAGRAQTEHPFRFKSVSIRHRGKSATVDFTPDWPAFGLRHADGTVVPIVGFETDRGTETNSPADLDHSSVLRHVLCYHELDERGAFVGRYKLRNSRYFILIQTSSELRKRNMMKAIQEKLGNSEIFLFKVAPKFARFGSRSAPTTELLTAAWGRIGHSDVVLSQKEG